MRIFKGFENLPKFNNAVVTVGSFDGIHIGHQALLERTKNIATENDGESIVLTFEPHPRIVLGQGEGLRLLTTTDEKSELFESLGIDNMIIIPFDKDFSRLSYEQFISAYLVDMLNVNTLVVGYDHHLGRGSEGRYSAISELSTRYGFDVSRVEKVSIEDFENISSTTIRQLLSVGKIEQAAKLLARPYKIEGKSDESGRVWLSDSLKMIPCKGAFEANINGEEMQITIDENGVLKCPIENENVKILLQ